MTKVPTLLTTTALSGILAFGFLGCEKKPTEATLQAQTAAKTADERVAQLEKEMADIQAAKQADAANKDTVDHVTQSQMKALSRQLGDARKRADERHRTAVAVAATPAAALTKTMVMVVPAQTQLSVRLRGDLATDKDQAGDSWEGTLNEAVVVNGMVVWPAGTAVRGVVAQSTPAGRLASGKGGMSIKLTAVGDNEVDAGTFVVVGDARGKRDAKYIGGTAALGALIGILSDKNNQGDHALGGAVAGAAAGTALAAGTASTVITIPASKAITFTLASAETVTHR